jgi:hypothetical protein
MIGLYIGRLSLLDVGISGVAAQALRLNENAPNLRVALLDSSLKATNRSLDLNRRKVIFKIQTDIDQDILRSEMHR